MPKVTRLAPSIDPKDRENERFPIYNKYRNACIKHDIECEGFATWLALNERLEKDKTFSANSQFSGFRQWMVAEQGGSRRCPAGIFPENYLFWVNGGRW